MKIYTKTGDKGETSLFGGKRISKNSQRIICLGLIDELNSILGVADSFCDFSEISNKIQREQSNMLRAGADLATTFDSNSKLQNKIHRINIDDIQILENEIDKMEKELPELTQFILPGGTKTSAFLHHARSICRRTELAICKLSESEEINKELPIYINRLSDWLFVLARWTNLLDQISDKKPQY